MRPTTSCSSSSEWAGKSLEKPLSYNTIERSVFREFLYKKALDTPIDMGIEDGSNPRLLERQAVDPAHEPVC